MDSNDAAVIAASRADGQQFVAIFERHYPAIARYARRRLSEAEANDVAAEVFTVAFARRESYDGRFPDALPWLYGIATNLMRAHHRAEEHQLALIARAGRDGRLHASGADGVTDSGLENDVAEALLRLTREDRETLLLYAWADLNYEEIGLALAIPTGTVRSRLNRARRRIRDALAERQLTAEEASNG